MRRYDHIILYEDSWEPERSLVKQGCEETIKVFWDQSSDSPSDEFIADPDDVWRCWTCGNGYATASSLKSHITRSHRQRQFHGSTADRDTRNKQHAATQKAKPHVTCEGRTIENVWTFTYLGSRFRADGDQLADVKARIAAATSTAGKMRVIWAARSTPLNLKMRIYKTGVCSRLTYGSEGWLLDDRTCKMLNGANSRMVDRITGKSPHEEASADTRTFDVVRAIRARRLKWVGHILRMTEDRMVQQALRYIADNRREGDLLSDTPPSFSWPELQSLAANRDAWRSMVHKLSHGNQVVVTINGALPSGIPSRQRPATPANPATPATKRQTQPVSPSARRYVSRYRHEAFFRPRYCPPCKPKPRKKKKSKPWTAK